MRVRAFLRVVAIMALMLAMFSTAGVAGAKHTGEDAPGLSGARISDALDPGGTAGNFHYYTFFYPGNRSTTTINLHVQPGDAPMLATTGFNVYSPTGGLVVTSGTQGGLTPNQSANVISSVSGWFVVQVFNYDGQRSNSYEIWATGLATQPAREGAPAPDAAPSAAPAAPAAPPPAAPATDDDRFRGTLAGDTTGTFDFYEFPYPGGNAVFTVNMHVSPGDGPTLGRAGLNVYGPTGALIVSGGAQGGLTPNVSANIINPGAGDYTVQVFNYNPYAVDYELWLVAP